MAAFTAIQLLNLKQLQVICTNLKHAVSNQDQEIFVVSASREIKIARIIHWPIQMYAVKINDSEIKTSLA